MSQAPQPVEAKVRSAAKLDWRDGLCAAALATLGALYALRFLSPVFHLHLSEDAAILMLLAVVCLRGLRGSRLALLCFVGTFVLAGGAYFLRRWHYFGYPLPNPYYKKGGGHLHPGGLIDAVSNTVQMSPPFCLVYLLGLRSEWRLPRLKEPAPRSQAVAVLLVAVMLAGIALYQKRRYGGVIYFYDGRCDVAHMLRDYASKQYTMATTEAGLLPFYSQWRDLDAWGLNDPWIAHNGGVTEAYLESRKPELIMFHAPFSPLVPPSGSSAWFRTVMVLHRFAQKHGYRLAAAFGETPFGTHYYYVGPDFPESETIVARIRGMDYAWHANGKKAIDYAMVTPRADHRLAEAARR
jgi:hypothetical protein